VEKTLNRTATGIWLIEYILINFLLAFQFYFQIQFILLFIHYLRPLIFNDCAYPKSIEMIGASQAIVMMILFSNFYRKTYFSKKQKINKK